MEWKVIKIIELLKIGNLIIGVLCLVIYLLFGFKRNEWKSNWYLIFFSILNIWSFFNFII